MQLHDLIRVFSVSSLAIVFNPLSSTKHVFYIKFFNVLESNSNNWIHQPICINIRFQFMNSKCLKRPYRLNNQFFWKALVRVNNLISLRFVFTTHYSSGKHCNAIRWNQSCTLLTTQSFILVVDLMLKTASQDIH